MPMRAPFESRLLLAAASRLVPRALRADWLREWEAEVWWWLNGQPNARSLGTRMRLLAHCRGALADARCLRGEGQSPPARGSAWLRTPIACLVAPALLLALVLAASGGLRRTREAFRGAPFPGGDRLAILSQIGPFMGWHLGVPTARVDYWNARSQTLDGIAIFVPYRSDLATNGWSARRSLAASVGPRFFSVLGVRAATGRVFRQEDAGRCPDCAVVSYDLWQRSGGRAISLNGRPLRVIGALPRGFRFPDFDPAVWTLADPQTSALAMAVCRLKPNVTPQAAEDELRDLVARAGGGIRGTSGAWVTATPLDALAAGSIKTLIPAWLGLIAAAALFALAGRRSGFRYRAFWAAKAGLSLTVLLFAGIEFGGHLLGGEPGDGLLGEGALGLWLSLAAPGFAVWWSWADQRTRCRICLARLTMPAPMGYGARMLFENSGTELLCPKGHGRLLLSGGAAPHSEWTPLDATWRDLFAGAPPAETGGGTHT
jgi:hypothetical protein